MNVGTYKPQIHVHYLPHLSLSFARHTNSLNTTFQLLSSDYSKSVHLQADRSIEFHTPQGCHYTIRIPRYGRDLKYHKRNAEVLVPSVGVNENGLAEVFRLNLELGRFMKSYEIDVGDDDSVTTGNGALQGSVDTGAVNTAAVAEESHGLMAFGTSLGTIEFWDSRARNRVSTIQTSSGTDIIDGREQVTALELHSSGLTLAAGSSAGLIRLYDLRSPIPLLKKDQGYGFPIHTLMYLESSSTSTQTASSTSEPKILSADKRIIKIWSPRDGKPWTYVEPAVDMHSVAWCKDSGMLLTANEGRQQHSFFIPQLGPAPKWCSFLDNLVEEMAEDTNDPGAYKANGVSGISANGTSGGGEVYDNYKFLTPAQLETLNLSHLIGTTSLLRPYMHGYFVAQRLYEEAKLIADPFIFEEDRNRRIRDKIEKERESRIRSKGKPKEVKVKVNKQLARKILEREEAMEERNRMRAARKEDQEGDDQAEKEDLESSAAATAATTTIKKPPPTSNLLSDPRFSRLFSDEDFAIDETSREFQALNPNKKRAAVEDSDDGVLDEDASERRLTAVEQEVIDAADRGDSSDEDDDDDDDDEPGDEEGREASKRAANNHKISTASYKKSGHRPQQQQSSNQRPDNRVQKGPKLQISSSSTSQRRDKPTNAKDRSFGDRISKPNSGTNGKSGNDSRGTRSVRGEREITFIPNFPKQPPQSKPSSAGQRREEGTRGNDGRNKGDRGKKAARRSASGNVFRSL